MSKESFKEFVKNKPELVEFIKNKEMTWQNFYEIYDLYGEDESVWNKYTRKDNNVNFPKINELIKNVDMDSIKEHLDTAQKALDIVQELTNKGSASSAKSIAPLRPINKFFED